MESEFKLYQSCEFNFYFVTDVAGTVYTTLSSFACKLRSTVSYCLLSLSLSLSPSFSLFHKMHLN